MASFTEPDSPEQQASIPGPAGSTASEPPVPWPGARNDKEGVWAMDAWLRALARGIGLTIAGRTGGLPTVKLAKALATYVRQRRQMNLFREDDVQAERRLDDLVADHEPRPRARRRAARGTPPIA